MTFEELLRWRSQHGFRVLQFIKQHREIAGVHYMVAEDGAAYIEFVLKPWGDLLLLQEELRLAFPDVECRISEPNGQMFES